MKKQQNQQVVINKAKTGPELQVSLKRRDSLFAQVDIALLFDIQRPAITKHLLNNYVQSSF